MTKNRATFLGFLTASFVPAVLGAIETPTTGGPDLQAIAMLTFVFYVFSVPAAFILGAPVFYMLMHFKVVSWWSLLISGFLGGSLIAFVLNLATVPTIGEVMATGVSGAGFALVFWLIWRQGKEPNQNVE